MVVVVAAGCSKGFTSGEERPPVATAATPTASADGPTNDATQSSDGGNVTIDVEWLGLDGDRLSFAVAMNTHSVDLDNYDLGELAVLRDDHGNEYRPESWDSAPGGHHRSGTLEFDAPDSVESGEAAQLEMVIRGIAGIGERVLTWHLN
jgi:hypothetical protein